MGEASKDRNIGIGVRRKNLGVLNIGIDLHDVASGGRDICPRAAYASNSAPPPEGVPCESSARLLADFSHDDR